MSNFFTNLFKGVQKESGLKEKAKREEKLKEQYEKEPGEVKRSYTDKLGVYARIRTSHDGVELWRFRSKDSDIKEINAPADNFKTMKRFVNYVKEELEKV